MIQPAKLGMRTSIHKERERERDFTFWIAPTTKQFAGGQQNIKIQKGCSPSFGNMSKPSKFGVRLGRVPWSYWLGPRCWFHRTPRLAHDFYSPAPSFLVCAKAIHHLFACVFWFLWFPQGHLFHGYLYSVSNYFNVLLMFVIFMGMCMNFHLIFFRSKTTSENASKTCVMDLQDSHGIPMDVHPGMKLQLQCFSPEHVVSPVMEIPEEFLGAVTPVTEFCVALFGDDHIPRRGNLMMRTNRQT